MTFTERRLKQEADAIRKAEELASIRAVLTEARGMLGLCATRLDDLGLTWTTVEPGIEQASIGAHVADACIELDKAISKTEGEA